MKRLTIFLFAIFSALCVVELNAQNVYNVMKYGAKGDGKTDDAAAIQKAINVCNQKGGGQVLFPTGHTFLAGPLEIKGGVELHLDVNSTLKCNPDESIYHLSAFRANEGEGMLWLWAKGAKNISISGRGTIDGSGIDFMGAELFDSYELKPLADSKFDPRPHVLTLEDVHNIRIKDVTICNGAYWTVHLIGCKDAVIDGISLMNNLKIRNGDGIDLDHSKHVRISNCYITSGDDCICLKNRREFEEYGSCHDIVVTNCTMTSRSCAIKIGSENMDSIRNVLFDNCIVTASNRGLGIQNRDEGTVTNVTFSNMIVDCQLWSDVWWGKAEPIYLTSYPRAVGNHKDAGWRFPKGATEGKCGAVSNIVFSNINCISENGCFVGGDVAGKVHDIIFRDVDLTFKRMTDYPLGVYDRRPCLGEGFVKGNTYAVVLDNAEISGVESINVKFDPNFPKSQYCDKVLNWK